MFGVYFNLINKFIVQILKTLLVVLFLIPTLVLSKDVEVYNLKIKQSNLQSNISLNNKNRIIIY